MSLDIIQSYFARIVLLSVLFFPETCDGGIFSSVKNLLGGIIERGKDFTCNHVSCCESHLKPTEWSWMWYKDSPLYESLQSKLYGQHLVQDAIIRGITLHKTKPRSGLLLLRVIKELEDHIREEELHSHCGIWDDPKIKYDNVIMAEYEKRLKLCGGALVILMFGPRGTGKSYTTEIIAENLYKKGLKSPLVHHFGGKAFVSLEKDQYKYGIKLLDWIHGNVSSCPYSMFIFDEFNELPIPVIRRVMTATISTDYRDAIFIFIMSTDDLNSREKMLELFGQGKMREDIKLEDVYKPGFGELFSYLEKKYELDKCIDKEDFMNGIPKNAIFAPFLPLERLHVGKCIVDRYTHLVGVSPSDDMLRSIQSHVMYGPEGKEKFALFGCKRIHSLVTSAISRKHRFHEHEEL